MMDWIAGFPLWALIAFIVSLIANVALIAFWWQARRSERQMRNAVEELQQQVNEFGKISRRLTELAQQEQGRCVRILDGVLTEREKEGVVGDLRNYGEIGHQ